MICSSETCEDVVYCLDYDLLVSEVRLEPDPRNKGKKRIKSIKTFRNHPAVVIGLIGIQLDTPMNLHDFGSPLTNEKMALSCGEHKLHLVSVGIPFNHFVRNKDLVLVPKTHFGLALGGLISIISKQDRRTRSVVPIHRTIGFAASRTFTSYEQLALPFP